MNLLRKDSLLIGIILGLLVPATLFSLIYLATILLNNIYNQDFITPGFIHKAIIFSILVPNLLMFRVYMINSKFYNTGKGILIITVIYTAIYYYFARPF